MLDPVMGTILVHVYISNVILLGDQNYILCFGERCDMLYVKRDSFH